jgi:hypothetical protein
MSFVFVASDILKFSSIEKFGIVKRRAGCCVDGGVSKSRMLNDVCGVMDKTQHFTSNLQNRKRRTYAQ